MYGRKGQQKMRQDRQQSPVKGFITIATGREDYYRLAVNLLHSYRLRSSSPLPFAILADRENEYTREFDRFCLLRSPSFSYLDKLSLAEYLPYDINIFIDADCLAYGDLNSLFTVFEEADDVSCFGRVLPLDDHTGWFEYDSLSSRLQERVSYVVGLHGGIYYLRRTGISANVFAEAVTLAEDYNSFAFKGRFLTPGDEPLVALSMALNGCRPVPFPKDAVCCYWEHEGRMRLDFASRTAVIRGKPDCHYMLVHWGTRFTQSLEYLEQIDQMRILEDERGKQKQRLDRCRRTYRLKKAVRKMLRLKGRISGRIRRILKK